MNYNFTDRVRKVLAMAREEAIRLRARSGRPRARTLIRLAQRQLSEERFRVESAGHQVVGKPVEQFRVRGRLALSRLAHLQIGASG